MKRNFTLFLALMMLASTVSCGGSGASSETTAAGGEGETTSAVTEEVVEGRAGVKSSLPESMDFKGDTVTILSRTNETFLMEFKAEEENGEIINDTIFRRNQSVCERLNCEMDIIARDGDWGPHKEFVSSVASDVMAGDNSYDIVSFYAYAAPMLATQGVLKNLYDIENLDLTKPWWHQDFIENASIYNKLYTVTGDINLSSVSHRYALFFNQRLAEEHLDVNLYELVDSGKWTLDTYLGYCRKLFIDVNGNTESDESDILALDIMGGYDAIATGAGLNYTQKTSDGGYEWSFYNEQNNDIIESYHSLFDSNTIYYKDNYTNDDNFKSGRRLFHNSKMNLTDKLRDMVDEYGILPYPKYNEAQDSYYSAVSDGYSQIMIPLTCEDTALAGAFLEASGEYSYKNLTPAYFEVAMKGKYLRDNDSARMFDIIMEGASYDFAVINTSVVGDPVFITRNSMQHKNGNFASQWASNESALKGKLTDLLELYKNA